MNNDKFPRTLYEAFGPYTNQKIYDPQQPMSWPRKIAIAVIVLACLAITLKVVLS